MLDCFVVGVYVGIELVFCIDVVDGKYFYFVCVDGLCNGVN